MNRFTENLNPRIAPALQEQMAKLVDWTQAPPLAGAYIAIGTTEVIHLKRSKGGEIEKTERPVVRGCWVIDNGTGQRTRAPDFGITQLLPGQSYIMRRPGHFLNPIALDILHSCFWPLIGLNSKLEVFTPEDFEFFGMLPEEQNAKPWVRPTHLRPNPLSFAIEVVLEPLYTVSTAR